MINTPPSWPRMSPHAKACYLVDSYQARNYADARRKVGRMERRLRPSITVMQYQAQLEKRKID